MSLFQRIARALFGGGGGGNAAGDNAFWLYVRCSACGESIRVRVNREHDLSAEYDGGDFPSGYTLHKDVVGRNCFRRVRVDLSFDSRRKVTEQRIDGGEFISREAYEAAAGGSGPA